MARKTIEYIVEGDNRDSGKMFVITEMPATQAEKWAMRAFMAMGAAGIEVPDDIASQGVAGLSSMSDTILKSLTKVPWDQAEPLIDELMTCVKFKPSADKSLTRSLVENDIEEIGTRLKLRWQVIQLHLGFSGADAG